MNAIIGSENYAPDELGRHSIETLGGTNDGLKFTAVKVTLNNGEKTGAYICNSRPGFWKRVFVPFEMEHKNFT